MDPLLAVARAVFAPANLSWRTLLPRTPAFDLEKLNALLLTKLLILVLLFGDRGPARAESQAQELTCHIGVIRCVFLGLRNRQVYVP